MHRATVQFSPPPPAGGAPSQRGPRGERTFFDSLRLPSRGAQRCVHPLAPSARGLRPQAVGERVVRLSEIFRAMARFSPSAPSGHRSPSGALRHLPRIGGVCLAEGGFSTRWAPLKGSHYIGGSPPKAPLEGSSRAAGEGWPGCHEIPPTSSPHKNQKTEECLRHSSIFCSYFALHTAIELVATAQRICAN